MPIAPQTTIDPLSSFMAGAFVAGTSRPCPLVATRFDVVIDAGLAVVAMSRTFRNAEEQSIEATMTFPVPVLAVLFALEVRIGERLLKAHARRKDAAREHYEAALERGKTAVLHEEALRGVHMLSIGHIAPGAEIEVRATWAMTLTHVDGSGRLRIPLTVGDIYGRSRLSDSDDLVQGGPLQTGTLKVDCHDGTATLLGGVLHEGNAEIALNAPIEIDVAGFSPRDLRGRTADGRTVALRIAPCAGSDSALDAAILVDHSGSMGERCSGLQGGLTKHAAALAALGALDRQLDEADLVDLWEFDDDLRHIGSTGAMPLRDLLQQLDGPAGGTEIGNALEGIITGARARDILLVTDGKSHALDVLTLARSGWRFCVVLVGADSLEAYVGHLAALTGGEIFVAAGPDLGAMLDAAIRSLRRPHAPLRRVDNEFHERRAGMELAVNWTASAIGEAAAQTIEARAVAAVAASLLLPTLPDAAAASLAEAEGLVTHLTSLVLVDEEAAAQPGLPATRKIALPSPASGSADFDDISRALGASRRICGMGARRGSISSGMVAMPSACAEDDRRQRDEEARLYAWKRNGAAALAQREDGSAVEARTRMPEAKAKAKSRGKFKVESRRSKRSLSQWYKDLLGRAPAPAASSAAAAVAAHAAAWDIATLSARIDWDGAPQRLLKGDLSTQDVEVARAVRDLADEAAVLRAARQFGLSPMALAIGLLARIASRQNRSAERIARAILGNRPVDDIQAQLAQSRREAAPVA